MQPIQTSVGRNECAVLLLLLAWIISFFSWIDITMIIPIILILIIARRVIGSNPADVNLRYRLLAMGPVLVYLTLVVSHQLISLVSL